LLQKSALIYLTHNFQPIIISNIGSHIGENEIKILKTVFSNSGRLFKMDDKKLFSIIERVKLL